jgi:hypothetical protein
MAMTDITVHGRSKTIPEITKMVVVNRSRGESDMKIVSMDKITGRYYPVSHREYQTGMPVTADDVRVSTGMRDRNGAEVCVGDRLMSESFTYPHTVLFDGSDFLIASNEWDDYLTEDFVSQSVLTARESYIL